MLNKKSIFNFVYAIALVGAIISCVGILSEFLNIAQLYRVEVYNERTMSSELPYYTYSFLFYVVAFLISASAVALMLLSLFGKINLSKKSVNIIISVACAVLFIMSFVIFYVLRYKPGEEYSSYYYTDITASISSMNYVTYYSFRTCIMSFVANAGIIVACNVLNEKCKKNDAESSEDA